MDDKHTSQKKEESDKTKEVEREKRRYQQGNESRKKTRIARNISRRRKPPDDIESFDGCSTNAGGSNHNT